MRFFGRSIGNPVKQKSASASSRTTMRICMLGARGVGKTSVITSLYNGQKAAVRGTSLFLTADSRSGTEAILANKKELLERLFQGVHEENSLVTESGIPGDSTETKFLLSYGMSSEKINIDLEIRDYPGEYLNREPQTVAEYIKEADAVIIAVDTPCMMEENGKYNEGKNMPSVIEEFLTNNLSSESNKLVLFVPLKCEKYFADGTISTVTNRIEKVYSRLIMHLKGQRNDHTGKKNVCCAITPIQTLGGMVFDSFERDGDGCVKEKRTAGGGIIPARINYRYNAANAAYSPKYCEQPLYYLLAFVSKQYQQSRADQTPGGWLKKLYKRLSLIPNIDTFILEIGILGARRMNDINGYKILCGRGRL